MPFSATIDLVGAGVDIASQILPALPVTRPCAEPSRHLSAGAVTRVVIAGKHTPGGFQGWK